MTTRLRAVLAHPWEKACDLGVPGLLAALVGISQVTVFRHDIAEQVASSLLVGLLVLFTARRWERRTAARAAVREHLARMQQPTMRRTAR